MNGRRSSTSGQKCSALDEAVVLDATGVDMILATGFEAGGLQAQFISPLRKASLEQQKLDMLLFWGGQIAPLLKHRKAKQLMESLIEETNALCN